jgi:arylsulfatase A-like enzyme
MAAIRARGDADRTIVVFNSDHGAALGEGGRYAKQVFAPEVQRVPTLYSWPGQIEQGAVRQDLAQNMDMARTLCSLCGIAPDAQFGGRDLFGGEPEQRIYSTLGFGLEQSSAFPNREAGRWGDGSGWPRRACVRTEQFRLDMNVRRNGQPVGDREEDVFLADCHADPGERINQAGNVAFSAVRDALRADLLERARNAVEPLEVPDFSAAQVGGFKVAE